MLKTYLLGLSALALAGILSNAAVGATMQTNVALSGTAQDCFAGSVDPVSGVSVAAFQISAAGPIVAQLDTMRRFVFLDGDYTAVARFDSLMSQLQSRVITTHALARTASTLRYLYVELLRQWTAFSWSVSRIWKTSRGTTPANR